MEGLKRKWRVELTLPGRREEMGGEKVLER
jgi:hypothetical protein